MKEQSYKMGMVGLGVMGRNLVLNMAEHGYTVAGYDKDTSKVKALRTEGSGQAIFAAETKADALVLFNRFYQSDFDLENLEVIPHLVLSERYDLRLPLRWVAILYGRVPVDFAITSGVHTYTGVLKGMMAGAKVTMMASELLQNGISRIETILADMVQWMEEHEYESVAQMQGSMSQQNVAEPAAFERANYMRVLGSYRLHSFRPWRMGMTNGE